MKTMPGYELKWKDTKALTTIIYWVNDDGVQHRNCNLFEALINYHTSNNKDHG